MAVFDDSVVQAQVDQAKGQLKSAEAIVLQKQAAVRQAQAQLSREKADLVKAQAGLGKEKADLVKAQAELGRDKANLAKAKSERDRYQILASRGAISLQELDTRATDAAAFEEQVRSAQAEVGSVQAEVSQAQAEIGSLRAEVNAAGANVASAQAELNSVQANVSSSKAQIQQLQTQRERTLLRAPANGLVIERIAQVGDVTSFDRKLFSLVRDSSFQLQTMLEEYQLSGVHIGTPVQVTSDSDKRIRLRGTVRKIAPVFDSQTHQPVIRIDLPPSTLVHSGMVLRVAMASNNQADKQKFTGAVLPKYP
jgi:multidrug resistance efflux pump